MAAITSFLSPDDHIISGSSMSYQGKIADTTGTPLGSSAVNTLTLSIIDVKSGLVVNSVTRVNILNTGRGTLDVNGNLVITLTAADTTLYVSTDSFETRCLVIDWTYGTLTGRHQVVFGIRAAAGVQPS